MVSSPRYRDGVSRARARARDALISRLTGRPAAAFWAALNAGARAAVADLLDRAQHEAAARAAVERQRIARALIRLPAVRRWSARGVRQIADRVAAGGYAHAGTGARTCSACGRALPAIPRTDGLCPLCIPRGPARSA